MIHSNLVCVRACVGPIQCIPQLCDQFDPVGVQVCIGGDEKEEQQPPSSFDLVDLHDWGWDMIWESSAAGSFLRLPLFPRHQMGPPVACPWPSLIRLLFLAAWIRSNYGKVQYSKHLLTSGAPDWTNQCSSTVLDRKLIWPWHTMTMATGNSHLSIFGWWFSWKRGVLHLYKQHLEIETNVKHILMKYAIKCWSNMNSLPSSSQNTKQR